jgi:FkbM family methyltransferase
MRTAVVNVLHRCEIDGISILVYDAAESQSVKWITWELQGDDYRLRQMHFDKGDVVVDIGAHVGLFSIYLAKRFPFLKVLAFEPFPANFRNCTENLRLNGVANVLLSPNAIANDARSLSMAADPVNSGGASAIVRTFASNGVVNGITSMTLDEVFSIHKIDRCKLLKIDCEGMEYEILSGTKVFPMVDYLAGEFHASPALQNQGWSPERLQAYCSSFFAADKMAISLNDIPE